MAGQDDGGESVEKEAGKRVERSAGGAARPRARRKGARTAAGSSARRGGATTPADAPHRRAVVVLGMHRSGTSAFTRLLSLCGAGLPAHLMGATEQNPKGYFESERIYALHERLLDAAGSGWDDLAPLPERWLETETARAFLDEMTETVQSEFGDAPLIAVKDPRICRLVPFWLQVFERLGIEPLFVIPVRNPLDVAASLARAEGAHVAKGILLWLEHFLAAEHDTRGQRRCFVSYDDLLRDWRAVLARVTQSLDLTLPRLGRRAEAEVDAFLQGDLRHHASSADELAARFDVPDWVKQVHDWARRAASGRPPRPALLDAVREELRPAEAAFGPLLAAAELARDEAREDTRRAERRTLSEREAAAALREELARARREVADGEQRVAEGERRLAESREALARAREEIDLAQHQTVQMVDWVKAVVAWQARSSGDPATASADLDAALGAFEHAETERIPQIASLGVRLAQQSAEIARHAELADLRRAERDALQEESRQLRDALTHRETELAQLADKRQAEVAALEERAREQAGAARRELEAQAAAHDAALREIEERLGGALREAEQRHRHEHAQLEGRVQGLWQQVAARDAQLAALRDEIARRDAELAGQRAALARGETERLAWQQLAVLRGAAAPGGPVVRRAGDGDTLRGLARLALWSLSLRLPRRLRELRDVDLLRASGLFDADYYLSANPDVAASGLDPLLHYVRCGAAEGRNPSAFFDTAFYLESYPDVAESGLNPLAHYLRCGAGEGRDPSPHFSTHEHLQRHPVVAEIGANPLAHHMAMMRAAGGTGDAAS